MTWWHLAVALCLDNLHILRWPAFKRTKSSRPETFIPPLLFPARTTHTRLFPTKHAFSYSYLMVGIPIGWEGTSGLLSTISGWLSVHGEDYLQRGSGTLAQKLKDYLQSVHLQDDYFAYLVTAPRFLGFSFNPVSFWYLYKGDQLHAMVLEVNNTFDERRMYFLKPGETWKKDFHVSPFNDRDGTYTLTAKDSREGIDNNIVLSNGKPKIVARIYSTEVIDPSTLSGWQSFIFMLQWCWVGFLTNPRILHEARKLWIKKLQVYYRPEPLKSGVGRNQTKEEKVIENTFRRFLDRINKNERLDGQVGNGEKVSLQVNTPAFYHELALSTDLNKTWQRLCFSESPFEKMADADGTPDFPSIKRTPFSMLKLLKRDLSQLDVFARDDPDYIFAAALICASRLTLGSTWLLKLCGTALKITILFILVRGIDRTWRGNP